MFDFRYHVASLAAVFIALIVGIVIGVGLSGQGVLEEGERGVLNDEIARLKVQLERATSRLEEQKAAEQFVEESYDAVMENRLAGKRIAVVLVGRANDDVPRALLKTFDDANGILLRLWTLKVPVDGDSLASLADGRDPRDLGEMLGRELVSGGEASVWPTVERLLVEERNGTLDEPADAVVVARTADPQQGATARLLAGLYSGLAGPVPAVWIDTGTEPPAGFSVVQNVDSSLGRVTLAVLLETGEPGEYGPDAERAVPPIDPVPPPAGD